MGPLTVKYSWDSQTHPVTILSSVSLRFFFLFHQLLCGSWRTLCLPQGRLVSGHQLCLSSDQNDDPLQHPSKRGNFFDHLHSLKHRSLKFGNNIISWHHQHWQLYTFLPTFSRMKWSALLYSRFYCSQIKGDFLMNKLRCHIISLCYMNISVRSDYPEIDAVFQNNNIIPIS